MNRTNNYAIQAQNAKARFLTYDQRALIRKFGLKADEAFLYTTLLSQPYRIDRATGDIQKQTGQVWSDGNSFEEVLTLFDLICDAKENRCLSGQWKTMQNFGHQFHSGLLENSKNPIAERFDREPDGLRRACLTLGGVPFPGGDISYAIELFDGLSIALQFWHGDAEFPPRLRYLWDENALQYIRYETMYYAVSLLLDRLQAAM